MTDDLAARCARAIQVITPDGTVVGAGRATLMVLGLLGWPTLASVFSRPPLIWLVEATYWIVARNRSLFGKAFVRDRS